MTTLSPSLSSFTEARHSELLKKYGVFFAFSDKQFDEGKDKDIPVSDYCSLGLGAYAPKANAKAYLEAYHNLIDNGIEELKASFTAEQIIGYQLSNYECYYTGSINDAFDVLKDYGYTREQVLAVFRKERVNVDCD